MPKETHTYTNGEITVVWKPATCIHSTHCWKGLITVFNPRVKPWINMEGSTTARIEEQVKKCPSGALSSFRNEVKPVAGDNTVKQTALQDISSIEVTPDGPYLVKNECLIIHADGREEKVTGNVALCRCGHSASKPFCDGSHRREGFKG